MFSQLCCVERQPKLWLWVYVAVQPFNMARCKAQNHWCSINDHFLDGAMSMSFAFLAIMPTNTFFLAQADNTALWFSNISDFRFWMFRWMSFLGWGNWHVICLFSCNANQYIFFGRSWQCSPLIVECVRVKIVNTPVTLILGWGNKFVICLFDYHVDQYNNFQMTRQWSRMIFKCIRLKIVDPPLTLISWVGQQACHLPFRLSRWPINSLLQVETMVPFGCWMC